MTENEAIEKIKYRMHTAEHVTGDGGMEDLEMAVNALEEIRRWHTSVVNPNIKNEFANRSTQICVNCDHKDEYIEELEAEVEPYRALEKRLTDMFGGELSLEDVTDELERYLKEPDNAHPINAKILTYEDAAAWDAYRAIGTLEECRAAVEKQKAKKPRPIDYKKYIGIVKNAEYLRDAYWCLNCNQAIKSGTFCKNCGQKLDWSDEE